MIFKPFSLMVRPVSTISTMTSAMPINGASSTEPFNLIVSTEIFFVQKTSGQQLDISMRLLNSMLTELVAFSIRLQQIYISLIASRAIHKYLLAIRVCYLYRQFLCLPLLFLHRWAHRPP